MAPKKKQEGRETYYSILTGRINYRCSQGHQYTRQFKLHRDELRQEYRRVGGKNPCNYRLVGEFEVTDRRGPISFYVSGQEKLGTARVLGLS